VKALAVLSPRRNVRFTSYADQLRASWTSLSALVFNLEALRQTVIAVAVSTTPPDTVAPRNPVGRVRSIATVQLLKSGAIRHRAACKRLIKVASEDGCPREIAMVPNVAGFFLYAMIESLTAVRGRPITGDQIRPHAGAVRRTH
jgi:hypothetical protein